MITGHLTVPKTVYYAIQVPETPGPWPVLLALHGFGQTAAEFTSELSALSRRGILLAVPQAPHHFYVNMTKRRVGFTWLTRFERDRTVADVVEYLGRFFDIVKQGFEIDPERVDVLGFSQGVSIAYRLWLLGRVPLRQLYACGGDLPPDVEESLGRRPALPVRILHGKQDQLVPLDRPRHAYESLRNSSFDVEMHEYEAGHELSSEMIDEVGDWVLDPGSRPGPGTP